MRVERGLAAVVVLAACTPPSAPLDPGPELAPPPAPTVALFDDADCERCHVVEASEWRGSAHRWAFTDEVFQAEWAGQPGCVRCHAPLADPDAPSGLAAANGVSCVGCHVTDGVVRSVHAANDAPHAVRVEPRLATSEACAGCHDFSFAAVAPTPYHDEDPLQATLTEWHAAEERGSCQHCHMRDDAGRTSHHFPGARDPALLAAALSIEGTARPLAEGTEVTLHLRSRAGHAVPTGDMYRRLVVSSWPIGREDAPASETLTRDFANVGAERREVNDDRVPATGERIVVLVLPSARRVGWRIEWQALDPDVADARWLPTEDTRRLVGEGELEVVAGP